MNLNLFDENDVYVNRDSRQFPSYNGRNSSSENSENSVQMTRFPKNTPLAMAYVPYQEWGEVYDCDVAFNSGTLFPNLDFPFRKGGE